MESSAPLPELHPHPPLLPWVPTVQCRDGWWSANTPTPARWGPPWAWPFFRAPTCAVVAATRNGVPWRCHCLPGRCQGKFAAIEGGLHGPPWPPLWWRFPTDNAWFFPRFPAVFVFNQGAEEAPPLTLTGSQLLPGGTTGLVSVNNATGAPITVTVPPGTIPGQQLTVKDASGTAGAYPLTVVCHPTVDGNPSYLLASNFASLSIYWMGQQWGTL